jgi:lipopolysaccharide transport system permease protein
MIKELRNILRYRQLIFTLTSRDLKARYRGSMLGFFWSLANPLLLLGVYTFVFTVVFEHGRYGGSPDPFALFLFTGILPWSFFAGAVLESTGAITGNAGLVKKVMFPAEAMPIVVVLSHLVHFLMALPILLVAIGIAIALGRGVITAAILIAPLLMLLQTMFIVGIALCVSSAAVLFRDLRDLMANLLTLGFFLTPILYTLEQIRIVPLRTALLFNPMTPFIRGYQSIFFFGQVPGPLEWLLMSGYALLSFIVGFLVFDRLRDTLAEAI